MAQWRDWTYTWLALKDSSQTPQISYNEDQSAWEGTVLIDGQQASAAAPDVVRDWLGFARRIVAPGGTAYIHRWNPHCVPEPYVNDQGRPYLYLSGIQRAQARGQIFADGGGLPLGNEGLRVPGVWRSRPYDIRDDTDPLVIGLNNTVDESKLARNVTITSEDEVTYAVLSRGQIAIAEGPRGASTTSTPTRPQGTVLPEGVGKIITRTHWKIKWWQVPKEAVMSTDVNPGYNPNFCWLDRYRGRVNMQPIWGCDYGQLLYLSKQLEPHTSPFGDRVYDITLSFIKVTGTRHNKFWDLVSAGQGFSSEGDEVGWVRLQTLNGTNPLPIPPTVEGTMPDGTSVYNVAPLDRLFQVY
jgi:hypothetical protein